MQIGGISIIFLLGLLNMLLILFQLSTGLRLIKVRFGIHKKTGAVLLVSAAIHGFFAFLVS